MDWNIEQAKWENRIVDCRRVNVAHIMRKPHDTIEFLFSVVYGFHK